MAVYSLALKRAVQIIPEGILAQHTNNERGFGTLECSGGPLDKLGEVVKVRRLELVLRGSILPAANAAVKQHCRRKQKGLDTPGRDDPAHPASSKLSRPNFVALSSMG